MNAVTGTIHGELIDDVSEFFAPMASDLVDGLVGQYDNMRGRINGLAAAMAAEQYAGALRYFIDGNVSDQRHGMPSTVAALFDPVGAIAQLNADFWNRALKLTDVIDYMPQKRRDEWFEQIRNPLGKKKHSGRHNAYAGAATPDDADQWEVAPLPEFEEASVRATLSGLLASRAKFFGERVDGIFQSLSREHVTNCPQGFNKRMILLRAITHYGTVDHSTAGIINDLRCVIAKFMGRDEPKYGATDAVITAARKHNGQWMNVDGNAIRIRIYNGVGTAHLEVHPDMAWRLNAVLASMHPAAIPAEFRTKPKRAKKIKDFTLFEKPLPFAVIELLARMGSAKRKVEVGHRDYFEDIPKTRQFGYGEKDKAAQAQAEKVLEAIGGVRDKVGRMEFWRFDYHPVDVLDQIVCSGCIPDHKSHQFYPTPASVAEKAIELADIGPDHACLEPSAGQGGLADLMPHGSTMCVEISELHCKILEAKGYGDTLACADFLKWAPTQMARFDRIVCNPPYSEGRWQAHIEAAFGLLASGGRMVAVLPSSAKGKDIFPGFEIEWSRVFNNEFAGTGVSVIIASVRKP